MLSYEALTCVGWGRWPNNVNRLNVVWEIDRSGAEFRKLINVVKFILKIRNIFTMAFGCKYCERLKGSSNVYRLVRHNNDKIRD